MRRHLVSFNGHTLNDTDFRGAVLSAPLPGANPVFLALAKQDSQYAGTWTTDVRNVSIGIEIIDYANRYTLRQTLYDWFRRGTEGDLIVTMEDGANYLLPCVVVGITQDKDFPQFFSVSLQTEKSAWKSTTEETDSWTVTASGQTKTITVGGSTETALSLTITPTTNPAGGWQYQYLYQLVNTPGANFGLRPWCITIDTATLVTAGKLQADCDDLRIVVNGKEVNRWIANANNAATKAWFNVNIAPGYDLTLKTAVAASGDVGELAFFVTTNNVRAINAMPASGIVYHGTEWFQYSGKDAKTCRLAVTARGALGTTLQAHAASDVFKYIENVIYVLIGNATATDPADDDSDYDLEKPIFNLSSSDNTAWVYDATTGFYDISYPNRPGSWKMTLSTIGKLSQQYLIKQNGDTGDPAMGMLLQSWQKSNRWQNETASIVWLLNCQGGFYQVSMTGQKYRSTVRWPGFCGLQRSINGSVWTTVWSELTPVNEDTWTAITKANQSTPYSPTWIRFVLTGSIAAQADAAAYFEVLTATVTFTSAKVPDGTLLSQTGNYPLSVTIENQTTGDIITVTYPMLLNLGLEIDGETCEVMYGKVPAHEAITLDDESRAVFLTLAAGSNVLEATSDTMGTMSVALSWYKRRL